MHCIIHTTKEAVKINDKAKVNTLVIVEAWRRKVCSQFSRDLKRCIVRYDLVVGDSRLNVS
jgi:hypothetical protein